MVRSFHYAVHTALSEVSVRGEDARLLQPWADLWYRYTAGIFVRFYLVTAGNASFIPENNDDVKTLLNAYLLEKAVYELGYALNSHPERVVIPLRGIQELLGEEKSSPALPPRPEAAG